MIPLKLTATLSIIALSQISLAASSPKIHASLTRSGAYRELPEEITSDISKEEENEAKKKIIAKKRQEFLKRKFQKKLRALRQRKLLSLQRKTKSLTLPNLEDLPIQFVRTKPEKQRVEKKVERLPVIFEETKEDL